MRKVPLRTERAARISKIRDTIPSRVPPVRSGLKLAALKTPKPEELKHFPNQEEPNKGPEALQGRSSPYLTLLFRRTYRHVPPGWRVEV